MPLSWSIVTNFSRNEPFNELLIVTKQEYYIKGRTERFYVTFRDQSLIYDRGKNPLSIRFLSKPALRQFYAEPLLETLGTGFNVAAWTIFAIEMSLNLFKSSQSFWLFINMLQLLTYLPVLSCALPENLRAFLIQYSGTGQSSIPFDSLPAWIPNPLIYLEWFKTRPVNANFSEAGYASTSFIYNFSNQLGTWITVFLLYAGISVAARMFPRLK